MRRLRGRHLRPQRGWRLFTGLWVGSSYPPDSPGPARVWKGEKSKRPGPGVGRPDEKAGAQQYLAPGQEAAQKRNLAPEGQLQLIRLREIARASSRSLHEWNERACRWRWEVTLLGDPTLNASACPAARSLSLRHPLSSQLEDDEVAAIMATRSHGCVSIARERMGSPPATSAVVAGFSLELGNLGRQPPVWRVTVTKFSRGDEGARPI